MDITSTQVEIIQLDNLSRPQFLALAIETSKRMGWVFRNVNQTGFIAYTCNGLFAWNAEIVLKIIEKSASIQSKSISDGLIDVRENRKNIKKFIAIFKELKNSWAAEELIPVYERIKMNFS